jgi:hypothetical protein
MTAATDLFAQRRAPRLTTPPGQVGDTKFAICNHDWQGTGYNSGADTGQVSRVVFTDTLPPGGQVWLTIKNSDCSEIRLDLHNCNPAGGANVALGQALVNRINGVTTPGAILVAAVDTIGFSATLIDATTVEITGQPGNRFTLTPTGFGTTVGTVTNPAPPTITTTVTAMRAGKIPFGVAIVANPVVADLAYGDVRNSAIASNTNEILYLPTGSTTEEFRGITIRDHNATIPFIGSGNCCTDKDCSEGWDCHSCLHFMNLCCHTQQILIGLEPFAAGTTIPVGGWVNAPIYYRVAANAGYTQLGAFSIFPTAGDTSVVAAQDPATGRRLVIKEVIDASRQLVYVGLEGI